MAELAGMTQLAEHRALLASSPSFVDDAAHVTPRSRVVPDALGAETRMGPKLHRAFRDAGLPSPGLESRTIMAGPETAPVWFFVNAVRGLLPAMEKLGVTTPAEVDLDTLEDRLMGDLAANDAAMMVVPATAAWVRVPTVG
jgi:hypothetical protein